MVTEATDDEIHLGGFQVLAQAGNQGLHAFLIRCGKPRLGVPLSLHPEKSDAIKRSFGDLGLGLFKHDIIKLRRVVELLSKLVLSGD